MTPDLQPLINRVRGASGADRAARRRAYEAVRDALKAGRLVRPETCERCGVAPGLARNGTSLIQGHHHLGYEHPLSVEWLCAPCHRADTPSNPRKGRQVGKAKLTDDAVRDIRASPAATNALAREYGVSRGLIYQVRVRKGWAHVE